MSLSVERAIDRRSVVWKGGVSVLSVRSSWLGRLSAMLTVAGLVRDGWGGVECD